ncbi:uncharacterized protein LOC135099994 isoform X1 [Scylla paramamosain]|uniref:uncharacterized protein LOC135099994 isoform X1 n=2 Tax=Scylla paramamosain TaxID=85552 RepID=UPI0030827C5A
MATTAATTAVYSQVFKKKLADALRVGTGGGLCFCGINVYFKNDKFYDDWVMPLFGRLEPETAYAVAQKAAKYNLVSKEKLQESRLLVSTQPMAEGALDHEKTPLQEEEESSVTFKCVEFTSSEEDLMGAHTDTDRPSGVTCESLSPSKAYDSEFEVDESCLEICIEDEGGSLLRESGTCEECRACPPHGGGEPCCGTHGGGRVASRRYLSESGYPSSDLSCCGSPRAERNCVTPDSPSLSMRVNIASPLRSSKMSLATMIDGTNPVYDRDHLDEEDELALVDEEACEEAQLKQEHREQEEEEEEEEDREEELRTRDALLPPDYEGPCGFLGGSAVAVARHDQLVLASS